MEVHNRLKRCLLSVLKHADQNWLKGNVLEKKPVAYFELSYEPIIREVSRNTDVGSVIRTTKNSNCFM